VHRVKFSALPAGVCGADSAVGGSMEEKFRHVHLGPIAPSRLSVELEIELS